MATDPDDKPVGRGHLTRAQMRQGGLTRAAQRRAERELKATPEGLLQLNEKELIQELVDAGLGRGKFSELPPEKRIPALMRALEYAHGKPHSVTPKPEAPKEPGGAGIEIG